MSAADTAVTLQAPRPRPARPALAAVLESLRRAAPALAVYAAVRLTATGCMAVWAWHIGKHPRTLLGHSWDAVWYAGIARDGYDPASPSPGRALSDLAFFPLFPGLARAVATVTPLGTVSAGLVVAWIAAGAAAWGIHAVGRLLYGDRAAVCLVALWALLPHGIVQSMAYTEPVLTALAAWALYALLTGRWLWAGSLALLAGVCRPNGIAVAAAVCCCAAATALGPVAARRRRAGPRHRASAPRAGTWRTAVWRTEARRTVPAARGTTGTCATAGTGAAAGTGEEITRPDIARPADTGPGDPGPENAETRDAGPAGAGPEGTGPRHPGEPGTEERGTTERDTGPEAGGGAPGPAGATRAPAGPGTAGPPGAERRPSRRRIWCAAVLAPLGWLGYIGWVGLRRGGPLGYFRVQAEWGSHFDFGRDTLMSVRHLLTGRDVLADYMTLAVLGAALVLLALLVLDRPPAALLVYTLVLVVIAYGGANYFASKPRFLLPAFPLLIPAALAMARARPRTVVVTTVALTGLCSLYGTYLLTVAPVPL
ncbi:hypothetical protein IHE55_15690 [Streptomyces pactum]|uniref:Glycosyltransferase RgtA/B/C/D-like domain-containing protein n=1 Tax=Streptomyces pactum TaxID=68249 RepID=A0ABS0NLR7_9ACTN|nr:hypothetical protein [Streptomyces pactum]MBH5336149.1 hypothetical protein [Streptomyces pactum]